MTIRSCEGMSTDEMVKDIWKGLYGDHTENMPGLILRVDRLESKQKIITWAGVTLGGFGLTAMGSWVWGKFTGH